MTSQSAQGFHRYNNSDPPPSTVMALGDRVAFDDERLHAVMVRSGDEWELQLTAKENFLRVIFPWFEQPVLADTANQDTAQVYYPYLGGVLERANVRKRYDWWGLDYPGSVFAPLVIVATEATAVLVAATNWPPRRVVPMHAYGAIQFTYPSGMTKGSTQSFRTTVKRFSGSAHTGYLPWQLAALHYKQWIDARRAAEPPPEWMALSEGFLSVQLQDIIAFDGSAVEGMWRRWKSHFNWVMFWGQMSHYAGPAKWVPTRFDDEPSGCCLARSVMHPRYAATLPLLAHRLTSEGVHVGFYAAAHGDARALREWLTQNQEYGANTFYIDILGRAYSGEPAEQLQLLRDTPPATLIEGFVDIYERPALLSGYVSGGSWPRAPSDAATCEKCTFPRLSRLIMGDRIAVFGTSNGEYKLFGPAGAEPFLGERIAFLLGTKLELTNPELPGGVPNPYLLEIKRLRDRVRWWSRRPTYLDTLGITDVTPGVIARRFRAKDGATFLAVDNPSGITSARLRFRGRPVKLPGERLGIVEIAEGP